MALDPNYIIKNLDGVQAEDVRYILLTPAQFTARGNVIEIEIPHNSEVTGGFINVTDNFDTGTTDTLKIGDSVDDDRYLAATDLKTAARTNLTLTGYIHGVAGTPQKLILTRTPAGTAATGGEVRVCIKTVAANKAYHTQG